MGKSRKCLLGIFIYLGVLLLILFLAVFVVAPLVFKYSIEIQRNIIFPTWYSSNENCSDVNSYGLQGVRNFYITVDEKENITLGVWQILPSELLSELVGNEYYNYDGILANKKYNILLYFHGNGGVRSIPLDLYEVLRKYFHIIAADYRGYADSTKAELNENNIVNDVVNLYKWVRRKTKARIFFWGHSLGTGISTHAIANLKAENVVPSGLLLEAPFSSVTDVMEMHHFLKLFSWVPWYRTTMIDPIVSNGFGFESTKYIVDVDCPIMILHAKDDTIVPYQLATKLYETAISNRNTTTQGNVTFYLFETKGYGHMWLWSAPELPTYVQTFIEECIDFEKHTANRTIN